MGNLNQTYKIQQICGLSYIFHEQKRDLKIGPMTTHMLLDLIRRLKCSVFIKRTRNLDKFIDTSVNLSKLSSLKDCWRENQTRGSESSTKKLKRETF